MIRRTPQWRLERYKLLTEIMPEEFPEVRDVVRMVANRGRLNEDQRRQQLAEWRRRQEGKAVRRIIEARRIPVAVRREVLASEECVYCGDPAVTVDHIIPVSKGGDRRRRNLAPACSDCNKEKLDFTPDEWRAWRLERGYGWPPQTRWERFLQVQKEVTAAHVARLTVLGDTEALAELQAGGWLAILDYEPGSSPSVDAA